MHAERSIRSSSQRHPTNSSRGIVRNGKRIRQSQSTISSVTWNNTIHSIENGRTNTESDNVNHGK